MEIDLRGLEPSVFTKEALEVQAETVAKQLLGHLKHSSQAFGSGLEVTAIAAWRFRFALAHPRTWWRPAIRTNISYDGDADHERIKVVREATETFFKNYLKENEFVGLALEVCLLPIGTGGKKQQTEDKEKEDND